MILRDEQQELLSGFARARLRSSASSRSECAWIRPARRLPVSRSEHLAPADAVPAFDLQKSPGCEPEGLLQELCREGRVAPTHPAPRNEWRMKQRQDGAGPSTSDFRDSRNDGAIRAKLGQALREQHDLMEPLPAGLVELLGRLEAGAGVRETPRARLCAAVDECVAAMVEAASRKPGEPGEA